MSLSSSNLKKRFFPSYHQIQQKIHNQHRKKHDEKVSNLQRKIQELQSGFDLEKEHEQIKNNLLENYHATNHQLIKNVIGEFNENEEKLEKQIHIAQWGNGTSNQLNQNSASNSYSLNYCIDEDVQEDNHYENHLKFKKQVLERDLFENPYTKNDKKKHRDQQFLFKNLYNPRPETAFNFQTSKKSKPQRKVVNNYFQTKKISDFKENIKSPSKISSQFYNKASKKNKPMNYSSSKYIRKQPEKDQFMEQHNFCLKNTKTLKDSYGKYLKQLSGTNIIKWRILKGQKLKDSVSSSINVTSLGNKSIQLKQIS